MKRGSTGLHRKGESNKPPRKLVKIAVVDVSFAMRRFGQAPRSHVRDMVRRLKEGDRVRQVHVGLVTFADGPQPWTIRPQLVTKIGKIPQLEFCSGKAVSASLIEIVNDLDAQKRAFEKEHPDGRFEVEVLIYTDGMDPMSSDLAGQLRLTIDAALMRGFTFRVVGMGMSGEEIADKLGFPPAFATTLVCEEDPGYYEVDGEMFVEVPAVNADMPFERLLASCREAQAEADAKAAEHVQQVAKSVRETVTKKRHPDSQPAIPRDSVLKDASSSPPPLPSKPKKRRPLDGWNFTRKPRPGFDEDVPTTVSARV